MKDKGKAHPGRKSIKLIDADQVAIAVLTNTTGSFKALPNPFNPFHAT